MNIEYIGVNDRQVGTGTLHKVHAYWSAGEDENGEVKRAASAAVRKVVGKGGSVAFSSMESDSYNYPQFNAVILVRVLTDAQVAARKELKSRRYTECDGCGQFPGQVVHLRESDTEEALCFTCFRALPSGTYQVRHYIQRDGRVQIN
jgi:hypothetical protein